MALAGVVRPRHSRIHPVEDDDTGLVCSFVIAHDRRRILHCNVTQHPTGLWITLVVVKRKGFAQFHDGDKKFGGAVGTAVEDVGLSPARTSFRSPWQNGVAERWVGSCWRDLLDHVIPLNERHLKRLLSEYLRYYHTDRTHLGLEKDTSSPRARAKIRFQNSVVPRLGGCIIATKHAA